MIDVDVCVVGAGPVGASLACLLSAGGVSVAIVDLHALPPMEHPDFDGRAYAIAAGSRRDLLEPAGVWANLPLPSCPIGQIRVSDGRLGRPASPLFLHFGEEEAGAGPFGFMVEARSLRMALNATLHASGIAVLAPASVRPGGVEGERAILHVADGRTVRARLVVAAEGRGSPLREAAGIAVTRIGYRQSGIVSAVAHERPHGGGALEHFLPGGPFAQLPMAATDGAENVSAIVWTEESGLADRMMAANDRIFAHEIRRRLGGHLGAVRPIGRRWLYRLSAMHAHRYVADRLALVGGRGARDPPDCGTGAQSWIERRDRAGGAGAGRGGCRGRSGVAGAAGAIPGDAAAGRSADAGGDGRAGPAVQQRQCGGASGAGSGDRGGAPGGAAQAAVHAPGDGAWGRWRDDGRRPT